MNRRNFLVNFLLWILAFFFGYTIKKEGENLNLFNTDTRMVLDRDENNISDKIGNLHEQLSDIVSIRSQGITGIGDETTAFFNAVNNLARQHKMILIPQDLTISISNCTISNKSNFGILCYGKIKRVNNSSANSLIELSGCTDVNIPFLNTDGNVANNGNIVNEVQHSLRVGNGCNKINIGVFNDSNPSGDTFYINDGNNITIDTIRSISINATGRNAFSLIKGKNIFVDKIISLNTGHPTMPGGIDLEPNLNTDNISNVKINYALVTTYGVNGFQIANPNGALVQNIEMNGFVTKINTPTNQYAVALNNVDGFKGNIKCKQTGQTTCDAVLLNNCNNIDLYVDSDNSSRGFLLTGYVTDFQIKGKLKNTKLSGITLAATNYKGIFDMTIKDVGKSGSGSVVYVASGSSASNIIFRGDFSKATYGHSCFRIEGTVSNLRAENLDMSGWADSFRVNGANAGGGLFGVNCPNYNYRNALPAGVDGYTQGMVIWNTAATADGKVGWIVVASGKPGTIKPFGVIEA
ncbi:hypothetical protein AB1L12_13675 [Peribacillus frigoritolerans]|uniref:hypothetical protein n=1 Tax=Peribacillus frigoritolerans TaxID=450367 RepID=UPI0039A07193